MGTLDKILSSRARAEIFRLLYGVTGEELHLREMQRRSGLNESTLRQELRKLVALDLLHSRQDSNRVYYRANRDGPLFSEIHNLVLKTAGLADVLRSSLLQDEGIQIAFVFGSIARGEERAGSDLDLMVIGGIGPYRVSKLLSGVSERIGREVNPHVFSSAEFRNRAGNRDHFIVNVLHSEKIFIIGKEHDLKAMVG
jgi:uncharacterized protein